MADAESFATLTPLHTSAMLRVAVALVGAADAEDATQEAIVRAWQAWADLRDVESLRPWLLRITVNICRQWHRGGFGTRRRMMARLPDEESEFLALLDDDPGDRVAALDLRRAINQLNDDMRLAIVLRYYGGMDASEIGATLGVQPTTIRTRLRRALLVLRQYLRDSGEMPALHRSEEVG
ncbi:MAG: RNA polymerase sigma factor [Ktedonobacterales bacterium]